MLEQVKKEDGEVSDGDRELEMQMHISNWRREREEREAERQRKEAAMEEIALKYARDIDIDSDDDIPIQRYTKPQLIYTIASDPNMPLNSHLTLGKNNKKKKKRPYWERNRADVGNTSRATAAPPSKMPRLVPGRTDIHDWLNNTPDPDLIQVPPDKFCILLTREELQRAIEDKDSYHWRSRVGYKWIVREKRDSSKCNELAATPNYKPIECSPLTADKEEGTNTVAVEIAEPSQLPANRPLISPCTFICPPTESVFIVRRPYYPDLPAFLPLSRIPLDPRTKSDYEVEKRLAKEVAEQLSLNMDPVDRARRIYWDVRKIALNQKLIENPSEKDIYSQLIQHYKDRIEYEGGSEEAANTHRKEIVDLIFQAERHGIYERDWLLLRLELMPKVFPAQFVLTNFKELTETNLQSDLLLWTLYLDFVQYQLKENWETHIKQAFYKCIRTVERLAADPDFAERKIELENFHQSVYVRYLRWLCDIGQTNDVLSLLQMSFEFSLCPPQRYHKFSPEKLPELFDFYWKWNLPRAGESDALGWDGWMEKLGECGPSKEEKKQYENKANEEANKRLKEIYERIKQEGKMKDTSITLERAITEMRLLPTRSSEICDLLMNSYSIQPVESLMFSRKVFFPSHPEALPFLSQLLDLLSIFGLHLPYQECTLSELRFFFHSLPGLLPSLSLHPLLRSWLRSFLAFILNKFPTSYHAFVLYAMNEYYNLLDGGLPSLNALCKDFSSAMQPLANTPRRRAFYLYTFIHCISHYIELVSIQNSNEQIGVTVEHVDEKAMKNLCRMLKEMCKVMVEETEKEDKQVILAALREYVKLFTGTEHSEQVHIDCLVMLKKIDAKKLEDEKQLGEKIVRAWRKVVKKEACDNVKQLRETTSVAFLPPAFALSCSLLLYSIPLVPSRSLLSIHTGLLKLVSLPKSNLLLFSTTCHILHTVAKTDTTAAAQLQIILHQAIALHFDSSQFLRMLLSQLLSRRHRNSVSALLRIRTWRAAIQAKYPIENDVRHHLSAVYAVFRMQLDRQIVQKMVATGTIILPSDKEVQLSSRFAAVAEEVKDSLFWRLAMYSAGNNERIAQQIFSRATGCLIWAKDFYTDRLDQLSRAGSLRDVNKLRKEMKKKGVTQFVVDEKMQKLAKKMGLL